MTKPRLTPQGLSCSTFTPLPLEKYYNGGVRNLFDVMDWNRNHNSSHPLFKFLIDSSQADKFKAGSMEKVDGGQLVHTVNWADACQGFENAARVALREMNGVASEDPPVVGILAIADPITYFIFIVGLLRAGYTPFPISPRNSPVAVAHLITKACVRHMFVSGDPSMQSLYYNAQQSLKEDHTNDQASILPSLRIPGFLDLYGFQENLGSDPLPELRHIGLDTPALIMHSSGSTAFPKPITITHDKLLEYGTYYYYGETDMTGMIYGIHSLPMFHIMGACQIGSTTMTGNVLSLFPPVLSESEAPALPSPETVLNSCLATQCDVLVVVPSFIETWAQDASAVERLKKLKYVMYAGGPLSTEIGNMLSQEGVNLMTSYGITEVGALTMLMPSCTPAEGWDWWKISPYLDFKLIPLEDDPTTLRIIVKDCPLNKLSMSNTTIDGKSAFDTNDLVVQHPTNPSMFKLLGRLDDQIMHSNGEKTNPGPIEFILQRDSRIKTALMFGRSKFQPGVLITPSDELTFDPTDSKQLAKYRNMIWETVEKANAYAPQHSRIFKELILVTTSDKPFEYTAKGTPRRQFCLNQYEIEIEQAYQAFEDSSQPNISLDVDASQTWKPESIKTFIRQVVHNALDSAEQKGNQKVTDDDNLFAVGADSLAATYIRNSITRALRTHFSESHIPAAVATVRALPYDLVFSFPSINSLSAFVFGVGIAAHASFAGEQRNGIANAGASEAADDDPEENKFQWPKKLNQPGDTILRVRDGKGEPPLIVFHGAAGIADSLVPLQERFRSALWLVQVTPEVPMTQLKEHVLFYYRKIKELRPQGPYRLAAYSGSHFIACLLTEMFRNDGDTVLQLAFLDQFPSLFFAPLSLALKKSPSALPDFLLDSNSSLTDPAFRMFYKQSAFHGIIDMLDKEVPSRAWFANDMLLAWEGKASTERGQHMAKTLDKFIDECLYFVAELPEYVNSSKSTPPVDRALDAVESWLSSPETGLNEVERIEVYVGTYGTVMGLPEERREEFISSGLGAKKVFPHVKIVTIEGGHASILPTKELIGGLQEGFIN